MELQECIGSALCATADFSGGRRISEAKQQTDHQISPQQREELLAHRTRINSSKKSSRLCLRQDAAQRCAAGLATEGIERARHLARSRHKPTLGLPLPILGDGMNIVGLISKIRPKFVT